MIHAHVPPPWPTPSPWLAPSPAPQVGDVSSTERGSGARYNGGKPDLSLIPLEVIARGYIVDELSTTNETTLAYALASLGKFQVTHDVEHLDKAIVLMNFAWADCAKVFEYGRGKYAAWNWAKGMAWSIPMACAGRHALAVLQDEQDADKESGHSHFGHFLANLVMLRTFAGSYQEGNDLPPPDYFLCAPDKRYTLKLDVNGNVCGLTPPIPSNRDFRP